MMKVLKILTLILLVGSVSAQDSSNTVYRLCVDNRARRSIQDMPVYRIPKGATEFILDFSKVLESPGFKSNPPRTNSAIRSAVITLPDNRIFDADVKEGWNTVLLGPDTLHDVIGRKSFKGFKDSPFRIDLGVLTKTNTTGNLDAIIAKHSGLENGLTETNMTLNINIKLDSFWSCRIIMKEWANASPAATNTPADKK